MTATGHSLRELVEKWLGASGAGAMRMLIHRSRTGGARCVHIRAQRSADTLTLFFFQHANGNWQVFPPGLIQPAMRIGRVFE
jgi:hypothetical protein